MSIEAGRAYFRQFGMEDRVIGEEDSIASYIVQVAAVYRAFFGIFNYQGSSPIDFPVYSMLRFLPTAKA